MIHILKASAGSGKTHRLTRTYIGLLLASEDRYAYRHILAVTFTNKATAQMKARILKELDKLARDPRHSPYFKDFVPSVVPDEQTLRRRSALLLKNILHDYGAFSVSTIDKFFQRTLKAFSREIGHLASYQVELDKNSLLRESVDRVLASLTEGSPLLGWLRSSMEEHLDKSGSGRLDMALYKVAERLRSDDFRDSAEQMGLDPKTFCSIENLGKLHKVFRDTLDAGRVQVRKLAQAVLDAMDGCGVAPEDTYTGFLCVLRDVAALRDGAPILPPTEAFVCRALDSDGWFSKKAKKALLPRVKGVLEGPLEAYVNWFSSPEYKACLTAALLAERLSEVGIAGALDTAFEALLKEKNVLSIDDSNTLLMKIIDGEETPFVYEKLGVRYEHFLLDEFQDTARIQWNNFRPLLKESCAGGHENLVVGDIKQSIYRFRGSDWQLLESGITRDFPDAGVEDMKENWRSLSEIVTFNNGFFPVAADRLDTLAGAGGQIRTLYGGVAQEVRCKDVAAGNPSVQVPGSVDITFCEPGEGDGTILETVQKVLETGALPSDITILVRVKATGARIAALLMEAGIKVISDDSLKVKSSLTVRRLVSLLSYVDNPSDRVNSYLASSLHVDAEVLSSRPRSLPDLCERLLREIRREDEVSVEGEAAYIQSFMDALMEWTAVNGNSLTAFLLWWKEADPLVSSPQEADAVRVMTIHKAKGLEFPYVVFAHAQEVELFTDEERWVRPDLEGTPLEGKAEGLYSVVLSKNKGDGLFGKAYLEERKLQYIDNLNLFYVAMTRAVCGLCVVAEKGQESVATLLQDYIGGDSWSSGELYDFSRLERKQGPESVVTGYPSIALGGRLALSADASDFFAADGSTGTQASERIRGVVLHGILSEVIVPEDLPGAVKKACEAGLLAAGEGADALEWLRGRIASVAERGWFPADRGAVRTECPVADGAGALWRPDRVVRRPDGSLVVVDYKFGVPHPSHRRQVERYVSLCRRMGYETVSGALWYLRVGDGVVEEVK